MKKQDKYKFNEAILWLLTIPAEELSDSMVLAHKKMHKEGQNEIWLVDYFENNLKEEIEEFIDWNNTFLKTKTV